MNLTEMDKRLDETMTPENRKKLEEMIAEFRPIVARIEDGLEVTQGHYGEYLTLLSGNKSPAMTIYILAKAGANDYGLSWAYKLITGK
jgi:hypothetical protein